MQWLAFAPQCKAKGEHTGSLSGRLLAVSEGSRTDDRLEWTAIAGPERR